MRSVFFDIVTTFTTLDLRLRFAIPMKAAIARLFMEQHGVIARYQALAAGMSPSAIDRCARSGEWLVVYRGVYRLRVVPPTYDQKLMAIHLYTRQRAVVSHRAAAVKWGFDAFDGRPLDFSVTSWCRSPADGIAIRCTSELPRSDILVRSCIPITNPTRTLIDLAGVVPVKRLEFAVEYALRHRLTSVPTLRTRIAELKGPARRGPAALRAFLEARGDVPPTDSYLETQVWQVLVASRFPLPVRQYVILDGDLFVARADFAYVDKKVAIEADGYEPHDGRAAWERDRERLSRIASLGWRVIHATKKDVIDPTDFLSMLARMCGFDQTVLSLRR